MRSHSVGMAKNEYDIYQQIKSANWFCSNCKFEFKSYKTDIQQLENENQVLREENKILKDRLEKVEQSLANLKLEIKDEIIEYINENNIKVIT